MYGVVCSVKSVYWGCNFFKFIIEIDQSEMTKSHMSNKSLIYQLQMSDSKIASMGKMLLMAKYPLPNINIGSRNTATATGM